MTGGGTTLVEDIFDQEEWLTHTENCIEETEDSDHDRQFRHGLGSQLTNSTNVRLLDEGRGKYVNKRKRTEKHPIYTPITRRKVPKLHHQDSNRQQDCFNRKIK
ncbi:hypothetical protein G6F43_012465 [Rhizopus delemar]|nr:hypothetical protein G6F43_012465 [Rhizopus delemar]